MSLLGNSPSLSGQNGDDVVDKGIVEGLLSCVVEGVGDDDSQSFKLKEKQIGIKNEQPMCYQRLTYIPALIYVYVNFLRN